MSNIKKVCGLCFLVFCLCSVVFSLTSHAEMPSTLPHEAAEIDTGVITGTLLEDGKKPIAGATVVIEIMRESEIILSLPKKTGPKGEYSFKSIFQSPDFTYAISSQYNGKLYRTPFISLGKGEATRRLDLTVGAGGTEAAPIHDHPQEVAAPATKEEDCDHCGAKSGLSEYKWLAILLSVGVLAFAIFQWKRRKS